MFGEKESVMFCICLGGLLQSHKKVNSHKLQLGNFKGDLFISFQKHKRDFYHLNDIMVTVVVPVDLLD